MMQPAARDVRALFLRSLQQLDPYRDEDWDQQIQELCRALLGLESSADETLCMVVDASAAIQQLLLELATRQSAGRPRQLILDTAAWMLLDDAGEVRSLEDIQRAL
jgi:hypothetical protein